MHEYNSPCPGKTTPRLIEDLLDYDPRNCKTKKYHLLADPAPQYIDPAKLQPLRTDHKDCRHDLILKLDQSSPALSADGKADFTTPHIVATFCGKCRWHFEITLQHSPPGGIIPREPCVLGSSNPLHHFRYVQNKSQRGIQPGATPKYEGYTELHYFKCSNTKCPAFLVIKITPPRLSKDALKNLSDSAKLEARRAAALRHTVQIGNPNRYDKIPHQKPSDACFLLYRYIRDALTAEPDESKRVRGDNKNFSLVFGRDCDELLKYLDFTEIKEVEEEELVTYWHLPSVRADHADQVKFLQDVTYELLQKVSDRSKVEDNVDVRFQYAPSSALKSIERCLGCWDYPRKSRTSSPGVLDHPHYLSLGACGDFTDEYILYAYVKQTRCDEPNKPYYLDCLAGIAIGRNTEFLQMELAKEVSAGELRLSAIHEAFKFFAIDPYTTEGDDHIIGLFRSRIDSAPRQKDEARECLRTIAKARKSSKLEAVADDKSMTTKEAYEFIQASEDVAAEFLEALAAAKAEDGYRYESVKALRVLANARNDPTLHTSATKIELQGGGGSSDMDLDIAQAYRALQIEDQTISDQNIFFYYQSLMHKTVGPGSKESIEKALKRIALDRKSDFLLAKLDDANATIENPASTADHPVGLQNIGNTCYLNSLLQFYYTVKPVREIAMNFDEYRQNLDQGDVSKRVGGQEVNRGEIIKAQQFVEELGTLYSDLKTASTADVKPSQRLAELALLSTEQENSFRRSSISSPHANKFFRSPVITAVDGPSASDSSSLSPPPPLSESVDVEMTDQLTPVSLDQDDTSSEATLVNSDEMPKPIINNDLDTNMSQAPDAKESNEMPEPFPRYETPENIEVIDAIDPLAPVEKDLQTPEKPPPIPPRNKPGAINTSSANEKSIGAEMLRFGAQQDVTEVIQNVLFRMSCAIKPSRENVENKNEQVDLIRDTFFGQTTVYLKKQEGWVSRQEDWNNLTVFPAAGKERSIYEALDVYFDPQSVEYGDSNLTQYASIRVLPPILQILIQRTAYDKATNQASKNQNWISADETIYLDRYLDGEGKSTLMARRRDAWAWKNKLRVLENRKAVLDESCASLSVPEAMSTTVDFLKHLQEEEMDGLDLDPSMIDNLEVRREDLSRELDDLEKAISDLRKRLDEQFTDMRQHKYTLQAVFMHRGTSSYGHYWIYIHDFASNTWREYNDERVSVVDDTKKIFAPDAGTGNKATPYYLVYVREDRKDELVDAVCRDIQQRRVPGPAAHGNASLPSVAEIEDEGIDMGFSNSDDVGGTSQHIEHATIQMPSYDAVMQDPSW